MAKHKKDYGLQVIQKLHLTQGRSPSVMRMEMDRRFGEERTSPYLASFAAEEPGEDPASIRAAYDHKNSDPELSRFVTGAQNADILRRTATWIHDHRDAFGQEILEVGCDVGLTTAVLAMEFPDRHITSVDFSGGSIRAASEFIGELGMTNVTFIHADIHDYVRDHPGEADTVFSMRCLEENYRFEGLDDPGPQSLDLQLSRYLVPGCLPYACTLSLAAAPGGTLISVLHQSPLQHDAECWMSTLLCAGWTLDESTLSQINCRRIDQTIPMELFVCRDRRDVALDELQRLGTKELAGRALDDIRQVLELHCQRLHLPGQVNAQYSGAEAELACWMLGGELISGLGIFDRNGRMSGKFALYARKDVPGRYITLDITPGQAIAHCALSEADRLNYQEMQAMSHEGEDEQLSELLERKDLRLLWIDTDPETGLEVAVED